MKQKNYSQRQMGYSPNVKVQQALEYVINKKILQKNRQNQAS